MHTFVFLTPEFRRDYAGCKELITKDDRPFIMVQIIIDGVTFGIPLRSNIKHPYVLWTDKANACGLDFTKTVVITDIKRYVDSTRTPVIRQNEFDALRGKEHEVKTRLEKYIAEYKKAKSRMDIPRNKRLVNYSALQYFEDFI